MPTVEKDRSVFCYPEREILMNFLVLSRANAQNISPEIKEKHVIISINDAVKDNRKRQKFARFLENKNRLGVLYLVFDDVDDPQDPWGITERDAVRIKDFVEKHEVQAETIVVHCVFGQCRSAGCAAALMFHLTGSDMEIFRDPRFAPNMLVYRKVLEAFGYSLKPSELREKDEVNEQAWREAGRL